jgi:hypothetical protein
MQQGIGNLAQRPEFGLGDFVSDVFKPVRKVVNKVVPRELQPILPVVASAFLGPMVGNLFGGIAASSPALAAALGAGTTSAFTQALTGSGQIDPASTLISAGIGGIRGFQGPRAGVEKFDYSGATGRTPMVDGQQDVFLRNPQEIEAARQAVEPTFFEKQIEKAQAFTGKANIDPITGKAIFDSDVLGIPTTGTGPESFFKGLTGYGTAYTAKAAAEEQLDLEEQERQAGIESAAQKRKDKQIYIDFVMRAGFTREEAERMAEGAGYSEGGRVNAFLGRFFSEGIGQAAKLAERGIKPFGQKQTYKQKVVNRGVGEQQFNEIYDQFMNKIPDEVVDQPTGEALYKGLVEAEAIMTGQKLGLMNQEQRAKLAYAMSDKVKKQIYDNPVPGMNNDYLEYMDNAVDRMESIFEIYELGGDLTPKPIFDGKEIIGAQIDFSQLEKLRNQPPTEEFLDFLRGARTPEPGKKESLDLIKKGIDEGQIKVSNPETADIIPFKPKDEKAEGGRIKAQDGDFMGGLEAIMAFAPERGGGVNEEAIAEYMAKIQTGELVYDPETDSFIPAPRKRRRQNTRPADNEEFMSDLMYRMRMNEMYGKKEGGRVELKNGGGKVPGLPPGKQVDAREGTFIPMGGAKRADDVPAMLSVNEFVLNDNAVAGLGKMLTGTPDPRAGARALYKIQDQLEAMVV